MANANDLSEELRTIVQTLANAIDWEREAPKRELNSYLVRGLVNFEKWLRCLLDDEDIDFDLEDFITDFFSTICFIPVVQDIFPLINLLL